MLAAYLYGAFGQEILTPSASNVFWFGGQHGYQRDVANRYYVRARHLETANGRWISQDPLGSTIGDWNAYRYANGRPTTVIDPSGTDTVSVSLTLAQNYKGSTDDYVTFTTTATWTDKKNGIYYTLTILEQMISYPQATAEVAVTWSDQDSPPLKAALGRWQSGQTGQRINGIAEAKALNTNPAPGATCNYYYQLSATLFHNNSITARAVPQQAPSPKNAILVSPCK